MDNLHKIAIVQHPPAYLNLPKSIELARQYIFEASQKGAQLIVFPETWLPGYPAWLDYAPNAGVWDHPPAKALFRILFQNSIEIDDAYFEKLKQAAIENACTIVMGAHEKMGRTLYNTIFYFLANGSYQLHRKLMPTYTERLVWGMGDGSTLLTIEDGTTKIRRACLLGTLDAFSSGCNASTRRTYPHCTMANGKRLTPNSKPTICF